MEKDKIEVGEYIRTKDGHFDKIVIAENEDNMYAGESNPQYLDYTLEDIKVHSKNIIDLIEEDDYVNEMLITKIKEDGSGRYIVDICNNVYRNKDIETIVTKEQFKEMEYRV